MTRSDVFFESNKTIKEFVEACYQTLKSSGAVPIARLEEKYLSMSPCMHEKALSSEIDTSAMGYVYPRLPKCIFDVSHIYLGQSESIFKEAGLDVEQWEETHAKARRRRYLYDGKSRLAVFLSSKSDIDDVIPTLLCFQIEWNKIHGKLVSTGLSKEEQTSLESVFKEDYESNVGKMESREQSLSLVNCESSYSRYRQETENWWKSIVKRFPDLEERSVYFVSSNTHSLINLLSGFAENHVEEILDYAASSNMEGLLEKYRKSKDNRERSYILYYILKDYETQNEEVFERRIAWEEAKGIYRHYNRSLLDISTQIIELKKLSNSIDTIKTYVNLPHGISSNGVIVNIDYPLGRTAYFVLSKLSEHIRHIKGIYVIGKAASLFAGRGDVIIPTSIYDQQTRTLYHMNNVFNARSLEDCFVSESHGIYDNQKAVTVLGTFIQNKMLLESFQNEKIMDIEMEAGPYLSAYYELTNANRYPENTTVVFGHGCVEFGIIHYVSDNPNSKKKLDESLAWDGVDATYAATVAVLKRIMEDVQE